MVVNGRPLKKARTRAEARDFAGFPAAPPHLLTWRVSLRVGEEGPEEDGGGCGVELNVVEEDVLRSRSVYCDQCRVVGWSGHPVCGKRYHFIIENDSIQMAGRRRTCCLRCGTPMAAWMQFLLQVPLVQL